jgi:hypothetical protein
MSHEHATAVWRVAFLAFGWLVSTYGQPSVLGQIPANSPLPAAPSGYYWVRSDPHWGGLGGFERIEYSSQVLMPITGYRTVKQASPVGHILEYHDRDTFSVSVPISKGENGCCRVEYLSLRRDMDGQRRLALQYYTMDHCNIGAYIRGEPAGDRHVLGGYQFARIKIVDQIRTANIWTAFFRVDAHPEELSKKLQTDYQIVKMQVFGSQNREQTWRIRVVH